MSDSSSTTKRRKANDGRATVPDCGGGDSGLTSGLGREGTAPTASSTTCGAENNITHKMDAMMQMMSRMEERQLASMSSLERRCANLEDKCSKLEHMLKTKTNSIKEHVASKISSLLRHHEYNNMLVKNQTWKYSTPVHSAEYWMASGYDVDIAQYLAESSADLKVYTEKLRRGEFPLHYGNNEKGVCFDWAAAEDPLLDDVDISKTRPHWEEFTNALKQFTPAFGVLPDGCETYFTLENIQLDPYVPGLLKDALMNNPFQTLSFVNKAGVGDNEGMSVDAILDIVNSNKHLRKLTIGNNHIQLDHMERIFSAVRYGSIVKLDLRNCFENGLGDDIMTFLLTNGGLAKLERLGLDSNGIASNEIALLADFLARNPLLKELDLKNNSLSGDCVDLLATSLRSNTSLRSLDLCGNSITDDEAFRRVLHNDSSLNSIADSNHSCSVEGVGFYTWNVYGFWKNGAWHEAPTSFSRAGKIYSLLLERNKSTSNVQHFGDIDVKLLPSILGAVQRYASVVHSEDFFSPGDNIVDALSIVYEVMRKWDKVFPLYNDRGDNDSIE